MIELIPAIDIIDGKCVRLTKGDYDEKTVYGESPADMAELFESSGFKRLHVVDLDGAKSKHVVNLGVLKEITRRTNLEVDFGGGVKTEDDVCKVFDAGASMVTVGSVAVTHKELFAGWLDKFGADRIILGADTRNGRISINGWRDDTCEDILAFLEYYVNKGVKNVLCTDISRDGMLQGPAFELYARIVKAFPQVNLIASGGVANLDDIVRLDRVGVSSVVFGKAIYEGRVDVRTMISDIAMMVCKNVEDN